MSTEAGLAVLLKEAFFWVLGVLGLVVAFMGKRLFSKIDELERTKLPRTEFNGALLALREDNAKLARILERQSQLDTEAHERVHKRVDDLVAVLMRNNRKDQ